MKECKIQWLLEKYDSILPTKRDEDAGFDIYTTEKEIWIKPFSHYAFSTGLRYNITPGYWLKGMDRGSTGSRGLHLHCGVLDQGYRGEIFVVIKNTNPYPVLFTAKEDKIELKKLPLGKQYLVYPTSKAIAQLIPTKTVEVESVEVDRAEWEDLKNNSLRGEGKLGQSGK